MPTSLFFCSTNLQLQVQGPCCPPPPLPQDGGVLLPTTGHHHHLPCSNARQRGSFAHHHHPSLSRTRDGEALLPTTALNSHHHLLTRSNVRWRPSPSLPRLNLTHWVVSTTTPPPSLKCDLEGILAHHHPLVHSNATRISILMYLITL